MSTCSFNPVTGNHRYSCPQCFSYISIQRYIDLLSDWVVCKSCRKTINVPSLINSTESKKVLPAESRTVSKSLPDGRVSRRIVPIVGQLTIFGGVE
jgi:ribosomal protein L37AE/L43A